MKNAGFYVLLFAAFFALTINMYVGFPVKLEKYNEQLRQCYLKKTKQCSEYCSDLLENIDNFVLTLIFLLS